MNHISSGPIKMATLRSALEQRMLLLDGAMGTELHSMGVSATAIPDVLVVEAPDMVRRVHRAYLEAGADIITTCTFNAQSLSLAGFGLSHNAREINLLAARIAVDEARRMSAITPTQPRFVVGSVGPTIHSLSGRNNVQSQISAKQLRDAYYEQAAALVEGGVDAILIETIVDLDNAVIAAGAAREAIADSSRSVDLMCSFSVADASGRIASRQQVEDVVDALLPYQLLSIGINCSFGPEEIVPHLRVLSSYAPIFISVHPNAGLPTPDGHYPYNPNLMCNILRPLISDHLVNIVGGCCGTTPAHIAALRRAIDDAME